MKNLIQSNSQKQSKMVVFQEWEKEKKEKNREMLFKRNIGTDGKESACNMGGLGSIAGSRRSPGE